jgi:hypothetical protein
VQDRHAELVGEEEVAGSTFAERFGVLTPVACRDPKLDELRQTFHLPYDAIGWVVGQGNEGGVRDVLTYS